MYAKILVPVDGSPFSETALTEAKRLAAASHGAIAILSVLLEFPAALPEAPKLEQASEKRIEQYLARLDQGARDAGVEVTHTMRRGQPAAQIVAEAKERGADLIVMASHGTGAAGPGAPTYGLGGVTFKVLHDTPCPVLVIPIRQQN